jgi:hypothetical protein
LDEKATDEDPLKPLPLQPKAPGDSELPAPQQEPVEDMPKASPFRFDDEIESSPSDLPAPDDDLLLLDDDLSYRWQPGTRVKPRRQNPVNRYRQAYVQGRRIRY